MLNLANHVHASPKNAAMHVLREKSYMPILSHSSPFNIQFGKKHFGLSRARFSSLKAKANLWKSVSICVHCNVLDEDI